MGKPRGTFQKRNREMKLKDKAKAKAERRAAQPDARETKGPQIAWDEPPGHGEVDAAPSAPEATPLVMGIVRGVR